MSPQRRDSAGRLLPSPTIETPAPVMHENYAAGLQPTIGEPDYNAPIRRRQLERAAAIEAETASYREAGWDEEQADFLARFHGPTPDRRLAVASHASQAGGRLAWKSYHSLGPQFSITPKAMARNGAWDNAICQELLDRDSRRNCLVSETSYVMHLGAGGIHSRDYERDSGLNHTAWLQEIRPQILERLQS